jgi:hydrogenase nickel incorporation protein HypA/HybF
MHELSVTQSLLEIALRHAQQAQARQVTALHIVVGQLASIVDDSVQFYWDFVAKDTLAAGAQLHFRRLPAELKCLDCGEQFTLTGDVLPCPACQSTRIRILTGDEFFLESIEIET